ncbi:MAG: translation initiation factor IF-1 [Candidatus Pacebacteria bacterium]|jgi:translation initiation factor IF-1|nr:translation initiation factor IF-1 [Candidatus Paceibacterota bacterium]
MSKEEQIVVGKVYEALPNAMFRVELADGTKQIAYLSGKMKLHRIKVLIGDTVHVVLDPYGGKGRVVKRT